MVARTRKSPAKKARASATIIPANFGGKVAIEKMQKAASEQVESTLAGATKQIEQASAQMRKATDEFTCVGRENINAAIASSNTMAKGYEEIAKIWMESTQSLIESVLSTSKAVLAAKTMRDVVELQSDLLKGVFDSAVADSTKISEISARMSSKAVEPISRRMNATVEKLSSHMKKAS